MMKKIVFLIAGLLLLPLSVRAEFTDAEKAEAYKYVRYSELISQAIVRLSVAVNAEGHLNRDVKAETWSVLQGTKRASGIFFMKLSRSQSLHNFRDPSTWPERSAELADAQTRWSNIVRDMPQAISRTLRDPSLIGVADKMQEALDVISTFNWGLSYTNPDPVDDPVTPFNEANTVVGPHGHRAGSKMTLARFNQYTNETFLGLVRIYQRSEVWPDTANRPLSVMLDNFSRHTLANDRAWAMHIDVMSDDDRQTILEDQAASSGLRGPGFFRALLQLEHTLNPNKGGAYPPNFRGRGLKSGVSRSLRTSYLGMIMSELFKVNSSQEFQRILDVDFRRFIVNFADMWQDLDGWGALALLFFDPLTPPGPPGTEPPPDTGITCGSGTMLNNATNQCEAVPVSCPTLDHRFSITNPDGTIQTFECKLMVMQ